jgi:hypothetical protein
VDARGKAGRMREARQGACAWQSRADARGNARQMRDARQGIPIVFFFLVKEDVIYFRHL